MQNHDPNTTRSYRTDQCERKYATARRVKLRLAKLCINGPLEPGVPGRRTGVIHGPANEKSGKCDRCELKAKETR